MNYADGSTSPRRNWPYLTPAEQKLFELDEAARVAEDIYRNSIKGKPSYYDRTDYNAWRAEQNSRSFP